MSAPALPGPSTRAEPLPEQSSRRPPRPDEISSIITDDVLAIFRKKFHFPNEVVMRRPGKLESVCYPPAGFISVYETTLQAGVRFPPPQELIEILLEHRISLSQLSCRATTIIMGLIVFFWEHGAVLTG